MKYLLVSDIHGSLFYTKKLEEIIAKEQPNKIIFLGDLYYHGPRNPLPKEYNPMEVCKIFNRLKDKLIAIKGNCDAEVDEMISEFKFRNSYCFNFAGKKIFVSHGHHFNIDSFPNTNFDIMIYGHFHTGFIKKSNGKIFANPGSLSLPKNGTAHSYLTLENDMIFLKDENGSIIDKLNLQ